MTEQPNPIPHHVFFAQLEEQYAFKKLSEYALSLIADETSKVLTVDKPMRDAQIDKAAHYKEFWDGLMVYIKNAQNHPNK